MCTSRLSIHFLSSWCEQTDIHKQNYFSNRLERREKIALIIGTSCIVNLA